MEDLSCPNCKNPFSLTLRVPKTLRCLHTYCVECFKLEHTDEGMPFVSCPAPSCGTRHYLENEEQALNNGLKTDYFIERASACYQKLASADPRCNLCSKSDNEARSYCETCKDLLCVACTDNHARADRTSHHAVKDVQKVLQETQKARGDPIAPFTPKKKWKCEGHPGEEAEEVSLYCLDCEKMVCLTCVSCDEHRNHGRNTASKLLSGKDKQFEIKAPLKELSRIRDDYARALDSTDHEMEELERACRLAAESVKTNTENLQTQLLAEQDTLMRKVEHIHDARVAEIQAKLKEFEDSKREMSHSIEYAKNALLCLPEDILDQEKRLLERLGQLCREFEHHPLEPSPRDVFVRSTDPDMDLNGVVGQVYTNPNLDSLTEGLEHVPFQQGKKTEFHLTCLDTVGSPLPATDFELALVDVRADAEKFPVRKNPDGTFTGALQPRGSGEHSIRLEVQYPDKAVRLAPITVFVSPALRDEAEVEKKVSCEEIQGMVRPAAIALGEQHIAVADSKAHKVFVLTLDGRCLNVVGEEGENGGQFNSPGGVDWWGENLVVADTANHRIQVLSVRGEFLEEFGRYGGHPGEFINPFDVSVSISEDFATIYVADAVNSRIQLFKMANVAADAELVGVYQLQNRPLSLSVGDHGRVFLMENLANQFKVLSHRHRDRRPELGESCERETPEPQPKYMPELELIKICTHKEDAEQQLDLVVGLTYDPQTQYVLLMEEGSPNICVFDRNGLYVGAVKLPGEAMHLEAISALNSCVVAIAFDGVKHAIFVLMLL